MGLGVFSHTRNSGSYVPDAILAPGAIDVPVKVFAKGPHVHVKDGGLEIRGVLPGDDRLFCGIHAADRGAVP